MTTLVIPHTTTSDSMKLESAAKALGYPVRRLYNHILHQVVGVRDPIVYGPVWYCRAVEVELASSGFRLIEPSDTWLAELPQQYLLREVQAIRAKEVESLSKVPRFYKPANDKVFHRSVYSDPRYVPLRGVDPESIVLVAEPVTFLYEARLWVQRGCAIATGSFYIEPYYDGDPDADEHTYSEAVEFTSRFLRDCPTNLTMTLDVGYIEGRGWAVIEANQAWASGVYDGTDPVKVLETIEMSQGRP